MVHQRLAAGAIVLALGLAPAVRADLNFSSLGTPTLTFDTAGVSDTGNGVFTGAGFNASPASGQLDSDSWAVTVGASTLGFGGSAGSGVFGRGANGGAVTTTGIYSFDVNNGAGTDRALGTKLDKDVTSATVTLRVKNVS